MTDLPNDDVPGAEGRPAEAPAPDTPAATPPGTPWTPAIDAGRAEARGPASAGDEPLRRRRKAEAAPPSPGPDAGPEAAGGTPPGERIAKAIARAGLASRRDAEAMILAGRVSVNGSVLASPALNVTDADQILVDGEPLPVRERSRLWIFHKPRGLVTTARDPEGRQTVFEVLPEDMPRVVAVGRLDINTEGLLLLTNDGGLAKVIAHPETGWLRRYRVRAHGDTDQAQLDRLGRGVTIDGMEYGPVEATLDRVQGDNLWLTIGLREGKNREVKRILEHLGLQVNRLIRLSFGPFQLGDLEPGLVEEVRTRVLKDQLGKSLAAQAGVDFESPVREPIAPFGGPPATRREGRPEAAARPRRDAARPSPQRVATGGTGPGPKRSVWRADEEAGPTGPGRPPRRGADPRLAQTAAAERGRERVGSIRRGERRVVVERFSATPPEPPAPAAADRPRRRYAEPGAGRGGFEGGHAGRGAGRPHPEGRETGGRERDARGPAPRGAGPGRGRPGPGRGEGWDEGGRPPRAPGRSEAPGLPERRGPGRPGAQARGAEDGARRQGGPREDRDAPRGGWSGGAGRPGGDKPRGAKSGSFKSGSFKSGSSKPGGFKSGGFKPGGPGPAGDRGPRSGGRPGGTKPGGSRPGGRPPRGAR